jgi:SAM-dependent methyltransferase
VRRGGDRDLEWAYLFEPYARVANDDVFDQVGVGSGVRLLDVACRSGYAAMVAAQRGAEVSCLDAAAGQIEIARRRTLSGDFRVGDMFDLPFADDDFDAVRASMGSGPAAMRPWSKRLECCAQVGCWE